MSKFSEFMKLQESATSKPVGMIVGGGFQCQICYEQVDEAEYFQVEKFLRWKCSQGHQSYVEEFVL